MRCTCGHHEGFHVAEREPVCNWIIGAPDTASLRERLRGYPCTCEGFVPELVAAAEEILTGKVK